MILLALLTALVVLAVLLSPGWGSDGNVFRRGDLAGELNRRKRFRFA